MSHFLRFFPILMKASDVLNSFLRDFDHRACFKHLQRVVSQKWHVIHFLTNIWPERPVYRLGGLDPTQDITT